MKFMNRRYLELLGFVVDWICLYLIGARYIFLLHFLVGGLVGGYCHYIIKNVAVKVKMNVEDNLDSDIFYDFWQLSGYAVALCRNLGHNSKIITYTSPRYILKVYSY